MDSKHHKLPFPTRSWDPSSKRPRVLVESSDPAFGWAAEGILGRSGYDVGVCWGPSSHSSGRCPLLEGGRCELAAEADVIVNSASWTDPRRIALLLRLRETAPETPVVAEVPRPKRASLEHEVDGCHVVDQPMTPASLVEAVDDAAFLSLRTHRSRSC